MLMLLPLLLVLQQPPSESAVLHRAEQLLQQNHVHAAIAELNGAVQHDPHSADAVWLLLARCHEGLGHSEEALHTLRAGLQANPESAHLALGLGEVLFRLNPDNPEAGVLLGRAVAVLPKDAEAHHYYAQWAYLHDKEDECAANERAALLSPGLNDRALLQMYTLLGLCEDKLDHAKSARNAFESALSINRRAQQFDPASAIQYARFLSASGEEEAARQLVKEIVSHSPGFGPVHLEIAKQLVNAGQFAEAVQEAQRALVGVGNDNQTTRSARSVLAKCLFALGRKDEANQQRQLIDAESKGQTRP